MKRGPRSLRCLTDVVPGRFLRKTERHKGVFRSLRLRWARDRGRGCAASSHRHRAGFGRIELLVVAAIVIILFTLYWGPSASERRKEVRLNCANNLQKIFIAMQIYANEHNGKFPVAAGATTSEEPLDELIPHYTVDTSIFICPASKDQSLPSGESIRKRKISYAYYMGRRAEDADAPLMSDSQVDTLPKVPGALAFSTNGLAPGNNHEARGGNFLFGDGHADFSPPQIPFAAGLTQGVVLLNPKP